MNKIILVAIASTFISACAHTYEPPRISYKGNQQAINAPKDKILSAAKRVLISEGYQITSIDNDAGTISTAVRTLKINPEDANCGTTMGIDYLKDHRTLTKIGVGIVAEDNSLIVRTNIEGEYRRVSASQDITLTCVSRGGIEQVLQSKIQGAIK